MIYLMKKSVAILALAASILLPAGTALAADGSPTAVPDAAPRMLELINRERAAAGIAGLTLDQEATGIALGWSRDMARAGRLSHNEAYLSPESMERLNATTVGENVAFADFVDQIHSLLMDSPPHRANILNADFRQVGVGAVRSPAGELYLTETFLTRRAQPGNSEERPSRDEQVAPPRSTKPPAPRRARPVPPARSRPPVAKMSRPAPGSRPAAAKPSRPAAAAPARATKPPAPPTPTAAPAPAAPPPASSTETVQPAEAAAPEPVEPPATPQTPSEADAVPEASESDAAPGEALMAEEAAHRRAPGNSTGDLVKALPALVLFRRWLGRRR